MKTGSTSQPTDDSGKSLLPAAAAGWLARRILLAFSVFSSSLTVFSATPNITASVDPAEIRPGAYSRYTITVEGGQPDFASDLKLPPAVELSSPTPAFGQQTTISNGNIRQSITLTWQITSATTGEHIIPAQELHIGGVPYQTNEAKLVVKDNPAYPVSQLDPIMTLETEKREFYVGEVVPITVNLYVHRRTLLRRVGLIEMPKDNFAIQRFPLQGEESSIVMGGVPYRSLAFQSTLSALQPGKFKLGPATSEIIIDVPNHDDRFQHPFFTQSEPHKVKPQCNDIEVTVLPLPPEGRPKGFSGAVGDFEISLTAEPHELSVGDPISAELTISGTGNFDALTAPALTDADNWKLYPARRYNVQGSETPSDGTGRRIGFTQVLIPKKKMAAIPAFELSFFSPSQKKYITLRTDPVPLQVKATEQPVEPPPVTAAAGGNAKAPAADDSGKIPTVKPKITDILSHLPQNPTWLASRPALFQDRSFRIANVVAMGALVLLLAGKLGVVAWRHHLASPKTPLHRLWNQLHSRDLTLAGFYTLAVGYINARGLAGEAIQSILERHNIINYGRPTEEADQPVPADERHKVLADLKAAVND